jgi:hypothetical protein
MDQSKDGSIQTMSCDLTTNGFTLTNTYALDQGGEQVTEMGSDNQWLHSNLYAGGQLLATYDDDGVHYQLSDWLGSRRVRRTYLRSADSRNVSPDGPVPVRRRRQPDRQRQYRPMELR